MKPIFLIALLCCSLCSAAQPKERAQIDSIYAALSLNESKNEADTNKVRLLYSLSEAYVTVNNDSAVLYRKQALKLAEELNYLYGRGICLAAMGLSCYGDLHTSLSYYLEALKMFEQINDVYNTGMALYRIGGLYFQMEKYPKAFDYFYRALQNFEKCHNEYNIARAHHSLGGTYINVLNFREALKHENVALKYFEGSTQYWLVSIIYGNLSADYAGLKDYNKAVLYASKAVRVTKMNPLAPFYMVTALCELGDAHYNAATDSTTTIRADSLLPAGSNANMSKAIQYYYEASNVPLNDLERFETGVLEKLSKALAAAGRHKEALVFYRRHITLKDTVLSHDRQLSVSAQETKREADLKDRQITINEVQAAGKKKERSLFVMSAALLITVTVVIWRSYQKQRLLNARLAEEKNKLEAANRQIAEEKIKLDAQAINLQELLVQKDVLTGDLSHAADMKTKFLGNVSHELRTPVTLLTGMLELMREERGGENERLEVAYKNSQRLQHMVEEILDLSKLDSSEAKMNAAPKEIAPLLRRMVYAFETFIEKEHLTLTFSDTGTEGVYISADEFMLEKVVNNLVYNAIKFNSRGGKVDIIVATSADGTQLNFRISNTGPGIKEADLPHVFERYYQGNTHAARAEGAGIGLSLVKEFTQLMGGTVAVWSVAQKETVFTLCFPVTDARPEEQQADAPAHVAEVWEHFAELQTVLLVEDNADMRYYLRSVLGDKVNLAEAGNGHQALDWLAKHKADLIITDLMMPEMGGEEFIGHLKKNEAYRQIPVITLTALADGHSRLNIMRLGIDDYIVKPFNAQELRVRVYNLLNNLQERRQTASLPAEQDDIAIDNEEAEVFKEKIKIFVLAKMKTINISVYDLAYELALSERQLYRLAKRLTGCTPNQLIREVRLQRAYELVLSGTICKVDDVARQVGFEDPRYFSRQFYERFGKRASEFL